VRVVCVFIEREEASLADDEEEEEGRRAGHTDSRRSQQSGTIKPRRTHAHCCRRCAPRSLSG